MSRFVSGLLLAVLGSTCWGVSAVCIDYIMDNFVLDPVWLGCTRLLLGGIILVAVLMATGGGRQKIRGLLADRKLLLITLFYALTGMALYQVAYVLAIGYAGAAACTLLEQTGLVYVMLYTCLKGRRLPRAIEYVGVVLAFAGVFCIATRGDVGTLAMGPEGLFWGLLNGVFLFAHNVIPLKPLQEYGTMPVNGVAMFAAGLMMLPFAKPWAVSVQMTSFGWFVFAASVVLGAVLGYVFFMRAIVEIGPLMATLTSVFEPVSSMAVSALWLGTVFTPVELLGCAAIVVMMLLLAKAGDE